MNSTTALHLLRTAPQSDKPSRVNPRLSEKQAVGVVQAWIEVLDPMELNDLHVKRVLQVVQNRLRPKPLKLGLKLDILA